MIWWNAMRLAAISRHVWVWRTFEGSDPIKWPPHMELVKAVYGY
jgi:hypothetical protein